MRGTCVHFECDMDNVFLTLNVLTNFNHASNEIPIASLAGRERSDPQSLCYLEKMSLQVKVLPEGNAGNLATVPPFNTTGRGGNFPIGGNQRNGDMRHEAPANRSMLRRTSRALFVSRAGLYSAHEQASIRPSRRKGPSRPGDTAAQH